jgi:hypothetical protein
MNEYHSQDNKGHCDQEALEDAGPFLPGFP